MYFTQGIILKKIDIGEADAFITIYTKEYGKMRARAQGVKKEDAKLKGHLEPLHASMIGFVPARMGLRLTYASMMHIWPGLWKRDENLFVGIRMVARIDDLCFEGERDDGLWREIVESFLMLAKSEFGTARAVPDEHSAADTLPRMFPDAEEFLRGFERRIQERLGDAEKS